MSERIIKILCIVHKKCLIRLYMKQITIIIRENEVEVEPYSYSRQSNHNQWQERHI